MRIWTVGAAVLALAFASGAAEACRTAAAHLAIIHNAVPERLTQDLVVAEVELPEMDERLFHQQGGVARVLRVIHGEVAGGELIVRPLRWTSCSHAFDNGRRGILVGTVTGRETGRPVLNPGWVSRSNGFRASR